jgi:Anticodon-binding domain
MNIISAKTLISDPNDLVGMRLQLSLSHVVFDGTCLIFSPFDDFIAISPTAEPKAIELVQISKIKDCQIIHARGQDHSLIKVIESLKPTATNIAQLIASNIEREKQRDLSLGVNVSRKGQLIYDQLKKTLPCLWKGFTVTNNR